MRRWWTKTPICAPSAATSCLCAILESNKDGVDAPAHDQGGDPPGEQSGYVAECFEVPVVTQGQTLDQVTKNLREAIALHLGEDLAPLGLAPNPTVLVTMELLPTH